MGVGSSSHTGVGYSIRSGPALYAATPSGAYAGVNLAAPANVHTSAISATSANAAAEANTAAKAFSVEAG